MAAMKIPAIRPQKELARSRCFFYSHGWNTKDRGNQHETIASKTAANRVLAGYYTGRRQFQAMGCWCDPSSVNQNRLRKSTPSQPKCCEEFRPWLESILIHCCTAFLCRKRSDKRKYLNPSCQERDKKHCHDNHSNTKSIARWTMLYSKILCLKNCSRRLPTSKTGTANHQSRLSNDHYSNLDPIWPYLPIYLSINPPIDRSIFLSM